MDEIETFLKYTKAIWPDIRRAKYAYYLFDKIREARAQDDSKFDRSRVFWNLTTIGLVDQAISCCCRLHDKHPDSLNLRVWLNMVSKNRSLARSPLDTRPPIDKEQLRKHRKSIHTDKVAPLTELRNNIFSHTSLDAALARKDFKKVPFSIGNLGDLIDNAVEIFEAYAPTTYPTTWNDADDYKLVLEALEP